MQIVIDIPEEDYNNIEPFLNGETIKGGFNLFKALEIIKNGKPLPKGHWIMTGVYYTGAYETIDYVECSCCGEYSLEEGDYCPNCGAKMVEPKESEE